MADVNELVLKIIAQDQYSAELRQAKEAVSQMSEAEKEEALSSAKAASVGEEHAESNRSLMGTYTELKSGLDLISTGYQKLGQLYDTLVGDTMRYAKEVRDLSTNISQSVEETSAMIQMGDDFGIEMGSMTSTLEMMTRRGIAPSVEKIAQMADEFVNTVDPVQRASKMMEAFGRSWTTLTPMLKEGGDAVRAAAQAGREMGLATEASVAEARKMEVALDDLGDRATVLKSKIGNTLIPVLVTAGDAAIDIANNFSIVGDEEQMLKNNVVLSTIAFGEHSKATQAAADSLRDYYLAQQEGRRVNREVVDGIVKANQATIAGGNASVWAAAGVRTGGTAMLDTARAASEMADQLAVLEQRRMELFDKGFTNGDAQVQTVRREIDKLKSSTGDTGDAVYTLNRQLQRLADQGFDANSKQIALVNKQLGDLAITSEITMGKFADISPQMEDAFLSAQAALGPMESKIDSAALSMKELNNQTIYNAAASGLSADAALTLAVRMGIVSKDAEGAVRAIEIMKKSQQDGLLTAEQYASNILKIQDAVAGLQDKNITVTVETIEKERKLQERQQRAEDTGHPIPKMASGGSFIVPPGYPNDSYKMAVETGEQVHVTPAGQSAPQSQVTIYIGAISKDFNPKQAGDEIVNRMRSRGVVA